MTLMDDYDVNRKSIKQNYYYDGSIIPSMAFNREDLLQIQFDCSL